VTREELVKKSRQQRESFIEEHRTRSPCFTLSVERDAQKSTRKRNGHVEALLAPSLAMSVAGNL